MEAEFRTFNPCNSKIRAGMSEMSESVFQVQSMAPIFDGLGDWRSGKNYSSETEGVRHSSGDCQDWPT